jgi:ADP-heptose:LPS heptosyltransferase
MLVEASGMTADRADLDLSLPDVGAPGAERITTLIHPGAGSPARRWPARRWSAVARAEAETGRRVLVTAGPHEDALAAEVCEGARHQRVVVAAKSNDVRVLVRQVAAAERVVCGDTGIAHLATALRVPSVVLFGPVSPARWGPPPDRPWHRALWAGRRGNPHGLVPDPGLLELDVADVLVALADLPQAPGRRRSARSVVES